MGQSLIFRAGEGWLTKIKPTIVEPVASGTSNGIMSSDVIPNGEARHCGHFRAVWRASILLTVD